MPSYVGTLSSSNGLTPSNQATFKTKVMLHCFSIKLIPAQQLRAFNNMYTL